MRFRSYGWLGLALAVYAAFAAVLPIADDELYYWCWAQDLQLSYYDHPPMVAYWIRIATEAFGNSVLAIRLPACLATIGVLAAITQLSRTCALLPLILFTLPYTLGAVVITPDAPLVLFWAAYVVWLVAVHRALDTFSRDPDASAGATTAPLRVATKRSRASVPWWLWLFGGVILGCGVLGKYTMALAVPAGFVSFALIWRDWRRWLPGYVLHGIVSFVVALPILFYNLESNFAPLLFQWRHAQQASHAGWLSLLEFVGVQCLLAGTLPFVLLPWVFRHFGEFARNPRLRVCACMSSLPMSFFLYKSTQSTLEGNWALVSYIAFWPLAEEWYERVKSQRGGRLAAIAGFTIPQVAMLLLAVHLMVPLPFVSADRDRTSRQTVKTAVMQHIAADLQARSEPLPVYTRTYQVTAQLRYFGLDARQLEGATRPSHFTQTPQHLQDSDRAYLVIDRPLPPEFTAGFGEPKLIGRYPLIVRGKAVQSYEVWRYSKSDPNGT